MREASFVTVFYVSFVGSRKYTVLVIHESEDELDKVIQR